MYDGAGLYGGNAGLSLLLLELDCRESFSWKKENIFYSVVLLGNMKSGYIFNCLEI